MSQHVNSFLDFAVGNLDEDLRDLMKDILQPYVILVLHHHTLGQLEVEAFCNPDHHHGNPHNNHTLVKEEEGHS